MPLKLDELADSPPWEWPEDADAELLRVLADRTAAAGDRLLAAKLAGESVVIGDPLAEALLEIVSSSDEAADLRSTCAISFGVALELADVHGFDDDPDLVPISQPVFDKICATLQRLYNDANAPDEVRRRALEAAVRAPQDWQWAAVRAAYISEDPAWKLTAVFGMRFLDGFESQVLEALQSRDPDILYEAVIAAGEQEVEAGWDRVVGLLALENTDRFLRLAAIEAVATIRPEQAREILLELVDCGDEEIAEAVQTALQTASMILGMDELNDDEEDDEDDFDDEDDEDR